MSARLHAWLVERIAADGPISFADFMAASLYDPEEGFFATASLADHFATSPHLSAVFATLLTAQLDEIWRTLDEPDDFAVVEVGVGDGTLALQILEAAQGNPRFARALRYVAVDRSERARKQLAERGIETCASIDEVATVSGCVIANELLDNIPFHLMNESGEIKVGLDGDRLILVHDPPVEANLDLTSARAVSPETMALIDSLARVLEVGYAFFFDYGFTGEESHEPIRGYQSHRLVGVLEDPGSHDVTGPVDFDSVAARARSKGLQTWGPVTQRDVLMALGYRALLDRMRKEQFELERGNEWAQAVKYFGDRGEAAMLVDPAGLGGLKVLAMGTAGLPEPRAVQAR
jgi:NADH dehydrogenase [ubiquinone] 1 alpha subcomplex assembly factor 7